MTEIDLISINVNSNLHSVFSKEKIENLDSKNMHLAVASKKQEKRSKGRTQPEAELANISSWGRPARSRRRGAAAGRGRRSSRPLGGAYAPPCVTGGSATDHGML